MIGSLSGKGRTHEREDVAKIRAVAALRVKPDARSNGRNVTTDAALRPRTAVQRRSVSRNEQAASTMMCQNAAE